MSAVDCKDKEVLLQRRSKCLALIQEVICDDYYKTLRSKIILVKPSDDIAPFAILVYYKQVIFNTFILTLPYLEEPYDPLVISEICLCLGEGANTSIALSAMSEENAIRYVLCNLFIGHFA